MGDYIRKLRPQARADDRKLFNDWMMRKVTTQEAIVTFKHNNKMNEFDIINESDFEVWMASLGYKRSRIS